MVKYFSLIYIILFILLMNVRSPTKKISDLIAHCTKETRSTSSLAAVPGPGEEASSLGPGAPVGGAGGPNNGEGAGAPCFLPFFLCFGAGEGATGVVGAATGTGAGGELTGTGAGGELTGTGAGGGEAAGGLVAGAGAAGVVVGDAAGDEAGVAVAGLGDEAGGDDLGEATGAGEFGVEGAWAGVAAAGVAGVFDGAAAGDCPPTPATTMQMNARERTPLRSIGE